MEVKYNIVFDRLAKESFTEAYFYLKNESPAAANGFKEELEHRLILISQSPYMYARDVFKKGDSKAYRAFVIYSYRVSYKIDGDNVIVLLIRHTSQEPKQH